MRPKNSSILNNAGIQGNVIADTVVVGSRSKAVKTAYSLAAEPVMDMRDRLLEAKAKIFLSYRRADSAGIVGRLYDRLINDLGIETVFRDVDNIPFGVDFRTHLLSVISKCKVVLVIIGPKWLAVDTATAHRRLYESDDVVRIEIECGLRQKLLVVPVIVDGAVMPTAEQLPPSIQEITSFNGTVVRADPDFHRDVDRLIEGLGPALIE